MRENNSHTYTNSQACAIIPCLRSAQRPAQRVPICTCQSGKHSGTNRGPAYPPVCQEQRITLTGVTTVDVTVTSGPSSDFRGRGSQHQHALQQPATQEGSASSLRTAQGTGVCVHLVGKGKVVRGLPDFRFRSRSKVRG